MQLELFEPQLPQGVALLTGYALPLAEILVNAIHEIELHAPFRHMITPGGHQMSVAMTSCGQYGWVTDRQGYHYDLLDPIKEKPWPLMPSYFLELAMAAASQSGFTKFVPDSCLINRYEPGAKLSLHQDKDELDFNAPVVSVSLGLPAIFLLGGLDRNDARIKIPLSHGDVIVWGGPARLLYHAIQPLKPGTHAVCGQFRYNLTFRKAR